MESEKNEKGQKLLESSKSGDLEMVKFLIEKEKVDINFADKHGYIAVDYAALNGNLNVVNYVFERANIVDEENLTKYLKTPLFDSVSHGHINVARFLIQKGCNTNIILRDKSLLDVAISTNKPDLIGLILDSGCAIDQYNTRGIPHLSWGLRLAKYDSVAFLLEKGADYRKCCIRDNFSPLHYSIHSEEKGTKLVKLLLNHVEKQEGKIKTIEYVNYNGSNDGRTVLHHACVMRNYSSVRFLLQYGADRNLKDKKGDKPYDLLYETDHTNVCKQIRALFDSDKQQQHSR